MSKRVVSSLASVSFLLALAACSAPTPAPTAAPDVGKRFVAEHGVVASGNPYASEAGVEMLRRGGNAVDAAVAATFAIGVVEPMMSGLGAGGGMMVWRQREHAADYLDFYSAAGAAGGSAVQGYTGTRVSARGVGVPGAVAGLLEAHAKYGRLPRAVVMEPAIRLAGGGYVANSLLAREVAADTDKINHTAGARRIFSPNGRPVRAGDLIVQPELAATLKRIATDGPSAFYTGQVAEDLVRTLGADGSPLTLDDLARYRPHWKSALCTTYRGRVVLSAPPPQSGMEVLEALNLLETSLPAPALPSRDPRAFASLVGALRVSVTDRGAFVGDPLQVGVPAAGASSKAFARTRVAAAADTTSARTQVGDAWAADSLPAAAECSPYHVQGRSARPAATNGAQRSREPHADELFSETTHLSVVDADGNAVSLTNTNGLGFGTGSWVDGFFLNSAMYNFSSRGGPNAPAPYKTPASTISPTILLRDGRVEMVVGSPGSAAIPPAIVQTIMYTLDYGLDPMQAVRMPRIIPNATGRLQIEDGFSNEVLAAARRFGYDVATAPPTDMAFGGVHVIARVGNRWVGAADPRRDGEVRGY